MKMLFLLLFMPLFSFSQKITENKIDDFTHHKIIRTTWEPFIRANGLFAYTRVSKIDSSNYIDLRFMLSGMPFSVAPGEVFYLKLANDSIIKLRAVEYKISCSGCGSTGIVGSGSQGMDISFYIPASNLALLSTNIVKKARIYTSDGYVEHEVKEKFSSSFNRQIHIVSGL